MGAGSQTNVCRSRVIATYQTCSGISLTPNGFFEVHLMNSFDKLVVVVVFAKSDSYSLALLGAVLLLYVLGQGDIVPWALFFMLLPVPYVFTRFVIQWYFGKTKTYELVRQIGERLGASGGYARQILGDAFTKDPTGFVEERKGIDRRRSSINQRIRQGQFDWPDVSWWRSYQEVLDLMDEVLL